MLDALGTVVVVATHLSWWWLIQPRGDKTGRATTLYFLGYICFVGWAVWDLDALFSTPAQPFAFAGLVATLLKIADWKTFDLKGQFACCYSAIVTVLVFVTGYFFDDDPIYFSQIWLLGSVVIFWLHVRLNSVRQNPINWMLKISIILFWLGILASSLGLALVPAYFSRSSPVGGLFALLTSSIFGIYGSPAVSAALSLELLSTPSPKTWRLLLGYLLCLTWVVLNACLGLVR